MRHGWQQELWERALGSLPGGNTRTTIFHHPYPVYLVRGEGCRVWDVDGVERIDFITNYTSLDPGHCSPRVVEAVQRQAAQLMSAAAPNELEIELAERIKERLPSVERRSLRELRHRGDDAGLPCGAGVHGPLEDRRLRGGYHGSHDYAATFPRDVPAPGGRGIPARSPTRRRRAVR